PCTLRREVTAAGGRRQGGAGEQVAAALLFAVEKQAGQRLQRRPVVEMDPGHEKSPLWRPWLTGSPSLDCPRGRKVPGGGYTAATTAARRPATRRACSVSAASTITRNSSSVPEGRSRTRPE